MTMPLVDARYSPIEPTPEFIPFEEIPMINDVGLAQSIAEVMQNGYGLATEVQERHQAIASKYLDLEEDQVELEQITGYGHGPRNNRWQLHHLDLEKDFGQDENIKFLLDNKLLAMDPHYTSVWHVPKHWLEPEDDSQTVAVKAIDYQVLYVLSIVMSRGDEDAHRGAGRAYQEHLRGQEIEAYRKMYDERDIALFGAMDFVNRNQHGRCTEYERQQSELNAYRRLAAAKQAVVDIFSACGADPQRFMETATPEDIKQIAQNGAALRHLLDQ